MQVACVGERLVPAIGVLLLGIAGSLEVRERVRVGRRHPPRITHGGKRTDEFASWILDFVLLPALLRTRPRLSPNRQAQPRMPGGGSTSKGPGGMARILSIDSASAARTSCAAVGVGM